MRVQCNNSAEERRDAEHHRVKLTGGFLWRLQHRCDADSKQNQSKDDTQSCHVICLLDVVIASRKTKRNSFQLGLVAFLACYLECSFVECLLILQLQDR